MSFPWKQDRLVFFPTGHLQGMFRKFTQHGTQTTIFSIQYTMARRDQQQSIQFTLTTVKLYQQRAIFYTVTNTYLHTHVSKVHTTSVTNILMTSEYKYTQLVSHIQNLVQCFFLLFLYRAVAPSYSLLSYLLLLLIEGS